MIRDAQIWLNTIGEVSALDELKGTRVGVEAAHYLEHRILHHARASEPLLPALGGLPLGLWKHVEEDLDRFAQAGVKPLFVFSGIDVAQLGDPFHARQAGAAVNATAWHLYDSHEAEKSVQKFGESRTSFHACNSWRPQLTACSIRHPRRPLPRAPVHPDRQEDRLLGRTVQRMGTGQYTPPLTPARH